MRSRRLSPSWSKLPVMLLATLIIGGNVFAQQFTGGLRGTVRDAQGVVPGATVTLTNQETNVSRETTTNEVGEFAFPALPPATYDLRAALPGYKTFERRGIRVGAQEFRLIDVVLEVGAIEETITVTGEAPLINTATASGGATLDRQFMESLPALARTVFMMAVTIPTSNLVGDPFWQRQQDQINVSRVSLGGGGVRQNNYLIDGVPITDLSARVSVIPTMEALDEVNVQVHTYDAEVGRTGGGVFNQVAKSGTNEFRGTGLVQTRPVWGQELNFFQKKQGLTKQQTGLADAYYYVYAGGFGGPIRRNRTFFWTAAEGYRSFTTEFQAQLWPSLKQRRGDFSTSRLTPGGAPVRIFNPFCRGGVVSARCPATGTGSLETGGEFLGGVVPLNHPAVNPVALKILSYWPEKTVNGLDLAPNEDMNPNALDSSRTVDRADMWTLKVEHKFTDRWSLSALYIWNHTDEPGKSNIMAPQNVKKNFFSADAWNLVRTPQVLVFNSTHVLSDATVLTARFGWTRWADGYRPAAFEEGVASLGFSQAFVNAISNEGRTLFPGISFEQYEDIGKSYGDGPAGRLWVQPYVVNATVSKLMGRHTVKFGGDLQRIEAIRRVTNSSLAGSFSFDRRFTAGPGGVGGHELASFLLGVPSSGSVPDGPGPQEFFIRYYAGYIQDDWRVTPKLSLNYGLRIEREEGLQETKNRLVVGFDPNAVNPLDALLTPARRAGTPLEGRTLRGGLIYAGVNGAPTHQGDPPAVKFGPRIGLVYALNERTVLRSGAGLFNGPWPHSPGAQVGFSRTTALSQSIPETDVPLVTLENPFPAGIQQPFGSSLGLLTGVGGNISFVDQTRGQPRVYQYSVDIQRELPGRMAVTVGYNGATGRDIGYGGTSSVAININQIHPDVAIAATNPGGTTWNPALLRRSVPNPFYGIPEAGELGTRPTIPWGQMLRPFPQFLDVSKLEMTAGSRRQYHALIFRLDRRVGGLWGGRFSYTWSRTDDNQFGESSAYASRAATPQNNYDLEAEYGRSNFDSPHRIVLAPIFRLPSPSDRDGLKYALLGGWNASAVIELVSGAPLNATMSSSRSSTNLGLFGGLQRPDLVGDPNTSGSDTDRVASADHPDARWFNAAAFANPGPGRFGSAPRTLPNARYQFRKNVDVVLTKEVPVRGSLRSEVRFEVLNLTNTPKFGGGGTSVDLASFGRITVQRGFMRIIQLTFRLRF